MTEKDIFIIHGVENKVDTKDGYAPFEERIRKFLSLGQNENVRFHPVNYSVLLEAEEKEIYSWMSKDHWQAFRWIGATLICDVLAYAYPKRPAQPGDFIYDLTKLLADTVVDVQHDHPTSEKWLLCHSLGCIVGFGFSWDVQVQGLITMGNPHDYFSVRYRGFGEDNKDLPQFVNFHNPWDPISTLVSKNPNFARVTDVIVSHWNPVLKLPIRAHLSYWTDDKVAQRIASTLFPKAG